MKSLTELRKDRQQSPGARARGSFQRPPLWTRPKSTTSKPSPQAWRPRAKLRAGSKSVLTPSLIANQTNSQRDRINGRHLCVTRVTTCRTRGRSRSGTSSNDGNKLPTSRSKRSSVYWTSRCPTVIRQREAHPADLDRLRVGNTRRRVGTSSERVGEFFPDHVDKSTRG